ncbi:unnamed protein product [Lymnaea stagnalis]|uniref:Aminopeptidase n=1 Tax=Lymnaea stagnalis TaxID=6523 RepID=A0AAV2H980_LYMST
MPSQAVADISDVDVHVRKNGCHVSTLVGFVLVLLAAAIAVGVGVIVHFAGGDREVICRCDPVSTGGSTADAVMQQCVDMASAGNEKICLKCSEPPTNLPQSTLTTPTSVPLTTSESSTSDLRLPTSVKPAHYDIELQLYMNGSDPKDFRFKGHVKIQIKCVKATDQVILHANILKVNHQSIRFRGAESSGVDPSYTRSHEDGYAQFFIVHLSKDMQAGKTYILEMNFTSPMSSDLLGLYYTSNKIDGRQVYLATTQFEPTFARRAFPCFDEPAMKATFNISLIRPEHLTAISNMPLRRSTDKITEDGITYVRDVFERTPIMSTYLVAFAVCDYKYTSLTTKHGVLFRAWATPESVNHTKYSLDVGANILTYFEEFFNISYPLPKEDMIALPHFAGAMENWGLITYMWFSTSIRQLGSVLRCVKVAQYLDASRCYSRPQWFGNLVSPAWWDDLWLNEGFASFLEFLGVDYVHPEWEMFDKFVIDSVQKALAKDDLSSSRPLHVPVSLPSEILGIFDAIRYQKGASVIRMMRHFLGYETFKNGIVRYLKGNAFGAVSQDDLWAALDEQVRKDGKNIKVKDIMDTWTLQANFPLVNVSWSSAYPEQAQVSQERFLRNRTEQASQIYESPFNYTWTIPITFTTSRNPNFNQTDDDVHWLTRFNRSLTLSLGPRFKAPSDSDDGRKKPWILANVDQTGFYRVNYELVNWEALSAQLKNDHKMIPVTNRAQLIDDVWNLAMANYLSFDVALNLVDYLDKELEYIPWDAVRRLLESSGNMFRNSLLKATVKKFMQSKLTEPYKIYRLNNSGASHKDVAARKLIARLACEFGVAACLEDALTEFQNWRNGKRIDPNLAETVRRFGITDDKKEDWDLLLERSKTSRSKIEKSFFLQALSSSNDQDQINKTLDLLLKPDYSIQSSDANNILKNVASRNWSLAWEFLRDKFSELEIRYGNGKHHKFFFHVIVQIVSTRSELAQVEEFVKSLRKREASATVQDLIDELTNYVKWRKETRPLADTFFNS